LQRTTLLSGAVQSPPTDDGRVALQPTLVEMFGGSPGAGGMPPCTVDSTQYCPAGHVVGVHAVVGAAVVVVVVVGVVVVGVVVPFDDVAGAGW
jgi:hypothetical protein